MDVLLAHVLLLLPAADPVPEPEDVKAGWLAFWIFIALCVATALLCWSLTRHLRKIRDNTAAGKFGPEAQAKAEAEAQEREAQRRGATPGDTRPGTDTGAGTSPGTR